MSGFERSTLEKLIANLTTAGFQPYLTSVGGSGLGILSPYTPHQKSAQDSPPMTPEENPEDKGDPKGDTSPVTPMLATFESKPVAELGEWAEARGKWLF